MEENAHFHALQGTWCGEVQTFCAKLFGHVLKKRAIRIASFFSIVIFMGATYWIDRSIFAGASFPKAFLASRSHTTMQRNEFPLMCSPGNITKTCPTNPPTIHKPHVSPAELCPEYFRWIHEDLRPWKEKGISKEMVESGKNYANIRIVVVNGKVYFEKYNEVFQTRDVFTIWGILQLLRLYPGELPNLDLMFACNDKPVIGKSEYRREKATKAPPVFHYCGNDSTLDIVFPDWSFWGWPEINVKPWELLKKELEEGNHGSKWMEREPYAYWKGNPFVCNGRERLMHCNTTDKQDFRARLYNLNWDDETQQEFKDTNLATQCTHRYKIYIEGMAWSVSEKYILACDSMTLLITPNYYDFFTRSLLPTVHYWPINKKDMCRSIKFAVDWGNTNTRKAQEIGRAGSKFIQEELIMNHVYDYMFHLLKEYSNLLRYKPTIPPEAIEVCLETLACNREGLDGKFMRESMVKGVADKNPCTMPPYHPAALHDFLERKENLIKKVEMWEESGNVMEINFGKKK